MIIYVSPMHVTLPTVHVIQACINASMPCQYGSMYVCNARQCVYVCIPGMHLHAMHACNLRSTTPYVAHSIRREKRKVLIQQFKA
jgi:hypothetical protein